MSAVRYTCRIRGTGLEPRFRDGEYILVDPEHEPAPGDEVLVVLTSGCRLIRELVAIGAGLVTVRLLGIVVGNETLAAEVIERIEFIGGHARKFTLGFARGPEVVVNNTRRGRRREHC